MRKCSKLYIQNNNSPIGLTETQLQSNGSLQFPKPGPATAFSLRKRNENNSQRANPDSYQHECDTHATEGHLGMIVASKVLGIGRWCLQPLLGCFMSSTYKYGNECSPPP